MSVGASVHAEARQNYYLTNDCDTPNILSGLQLGSEVKLPMRLTTSLSQEKIVGPTPSKTVKKSIPLRMPLSVSLLGNPDLSKSVFSLVLENRLGHGHDVKIEKIELDVCDAIVTAYQTPELVCT